ncbi:MAG: hypothetical protein ABIR39_22100 [Nocardioides sp.]|uniref:hypothetical protein n=1 Tax=Nocardioides sp. TaxID=35761 RepID=UPI003267464E
MTRARLILALLLGALISCTPNSDPNRSKADPPPYPRVAGLDSGCPSPEQEPNLPDGLLPTGATQVRLCNLEGDRYFIGRNRKVEDDFDLPPDALATGVDDLVGIVNAQTITEEPACGGGTLDRGDGVIMGAKEVHHVFSDLLWQQRSPPPRRISRSGRSASRPARTRLRCCWRNTW